MYLSQNISHNIKIYVLKKTFDKFTFYNKVLQLSTTEIKLATHKVSCILWHTLRNHKELPDWLANFVHLLFCFSINFCKLTFFISVTHCFINWKLWIKKLLLKCLFYRFHLTGIYWLLKCIKVMFQDITQSYVLLEPWCWINLVLAW